MNEWILIGISGILSGMAASLGLGGGTVLLIYLTAIAGMEQLQSQGINLIFFIPIALLSLILHSKSKLIEWKTALLSAALGLLGAWAGWYIGGMIDSKWLSKIFAVGILILGLTEVFSPSVKKDNKDIKKNKNIY